MTLIKSLLIILLLASGIFLTVYLKSKAVRGGGAEPLGTYLAYIAVQRASVYLIDPGDPTRSIRISKSPGLDAYWFLLTVDFYDPGTGTYSNLRIRYIFWVEEADGDTTTVNGGPVMKAPTARDPDAPAPVRVSSVSDACFFHWSANDAVSGRKYMVLRTAGKDGVCYTSDDGKVFIHSDMTHVDAPVNMSGREIISSVNRGTSDPVITGFLVLERGSVLMCDTDLSNCSRPLLSGVGRAGELARNPTNGDIYLCADGRLYVFNGESLNPLGVSCGSTRKAWYDDTAVYTVSSRNLKKLPYGGSSWQTIYEGGDVKFIEGLTQNYVVISTSGGLAAVSKDGTSRLTIDRDYIYGWAAPDSFLYTKSETGVRYACLWAEGSSDPSCVPDAYWVGFSLATEGALNTSGGFLVPIHRLLMSEGGSLYALDPADPSSKIKLGTTPRGSYSLGFGIGNHVLLRVLNNEQTDVFYADLATPGSLRRITDTADDSEYPLFYPSLPRSLSLLSLVNVFGQGGP